MIFAQPLFLFGLFSLAIPIIVHLFNFRKPKVVYFTKVQFLKASVIEVNKTQKLKNYLVLLSRLLFLLFLVMAFSQPVLKSDSKVSAGLVGIYIDNSQSMLSSSETGDILTGSIRMTEQLANNLSNNTKYVFLDNDFESSDHNILNRDQLKDRLTEIGISSKTRTIAQAQKKLFSNIEKLGYDKGASMYLISDFQKSVNKNTPEMLNTQTSLINLSTKGKLNVYVDTVYMENPFVMPDENTILKVVIACSGDEAVENVPIKLVVDDIVNGNTNVNLGPGQTVTVEFNVKIKANKASLCKILLEDRPILFDNEYFFVLQPIKPIQVILVSNKINSSYSSVFKDDPSFILDQYSFNSINYGKLKQAELLIIDGVDYADHILLEYANEVLRNNRSVVFSPSSDYIKNNTQEKLQKLVGQNVSVLKDTSAKGLEYVQMPDTRNPFFKNIYRSTKDNIQLPKVRLVLDAKLTNIYNTNHGNQLVTKYPNKAGSLYSINTVLDSKYSEFQTHPFFVTFMLKVALSNNSTEESLSNTVNTNVLKINQVGTLGTNNFKIKSKETEVIPSVYVNNSVSILDLSQTNLNTGFYEVYHNDVLVKNIALNYENTESRLESYTNAELQKMFAGNKFINVIDAGGVNEAVKEIKSNFDTNYLWKYCLILALLFLALEVILLRFFS